MGLGTEILFMLMLGLVVLGPKRLHAMLGHVARAKAELENATRGISLNLRPNSRSRPWTGKLVVHLNWLESSELCPTPKSVPDNVFIIHY